MNKLQINSNSDYLIVFKDGSKKQISSEYGEKILGLSGTEQKNFTLAGQLYSFSNVAKLLPIQEYYQQYPNKKPTTTTKFKDYPQASFSKSKRIKFLNAIVSGIEKYIASPGFKGTDSPKKLIEKILFRIRVVEGEEEDNKPFTPSSLIYGGK